MAGPFLIIVILVTRGNWATSGHICFTRLFET